MKFFFDTEFIERPCTIDLISIGMVTEDGHSFYRESSEVDWSQATPWIWENVVPHLEGEDSPRYVTRKVLAAEILEFIMSHGDERKPEFWAYYADYDWVVFCWLFGSMIDLPKGFPMFCRDLKEWNVSLGERELPKQAGSEHHALADARWVRDTWIWIDEYLASGDW